MLIDWFFICFIDRARLILFNSYNWSILNFKVKNYIHQIKDSDKKKKSFLIIIREKKWTDWIQWKTILRPTHWEWRTRESTTWPCLEATLRNSAPSSSKTPVVEWPKASFGSEQCQSHITSCTKFTAKNSKSNKCRKSSPKSILQ